MKTRALLFVAALVIAAVPAVILLTSRREPPAPAPGIPLTLAEERARRVSDLAYDLSLAIPAERSQPINGRMTATFTLSDERRPLAFDFAQPGEKVLSVRANGQRVTATVTNGHIVIAADALRAGRNQIEIEFVAGDESLNRNDEFLYALFVPARASLALPVFDQPDLKARWRLQLQVPEGWTAVSNGADRGGFDFEPTQPIPTYLFTFAAGRFQTDTAERDGRTFTMYHRETDVAKLARNRDAIFDLHARALAWLEDYTGIPYPFGKFDFVLIPSFQFGGMEHPGAVFYNASSLLLDEAATQNQMLGRASLISHETAHMWFGDLVTMKWFNDVWMKEVFANFMAAKMVNPSFPEVNHDLRFLFSHYPAAYEVDRTEGANPIRQELANLNEAGSLYGAIIYQKAPIVMRQLEELIGPDTMRDGLQEYLRNHSFGNATWPDLIQLLDARTDHDLQQWSRMWVETAGRPSIGPGLQPADAAGGAPGTAAGETPGRIAGGMAGETAGETPGGMAGATAGETAGRAPRRFPVQYGDVRLNPSDIDFLTTSLPAIADPVERGSALIILWENMLEGRVAPRRVFDTLLASVAVERNELIVTRMLGYLSEAFWRFTPASERAAVAPRIEQVLREGLQRASSTSLKTAWLNALRGMATTPETLAWLERLWRRDETVQGVPMSEADETELALELAVRDVPNAEAILQAQHDRIANADRKARFVFVRPAVARDAAVRARFFESLKDVANRRREARVLEGMRYLHHPRRAETSAPLVRPSLELVREIQRTGDIFFPKRWADATLGGYQSPDVARDVRAFIDSLPSDYPPRLRWVLLASADPLFRAARLR